MATESLAVVKDLPGVGVLLPGHVADLLEERKVDVGLDIALGPRVPVPVPGATEIASLLDDPQVLHPGITEAGPHLQSPETTSDDHDIDLIDQGRTVDTRLDVGVIGVVGERSDDVDVLVVAVDTKTLVTLDPVTLPHDVGIEEGLFGVHNDSPS